MVFNMNRDFQKLLSDWPLSFIRDVDISSSISVTPQKRYALVNRALSKGTLIHLKRGLYLIGKPFNKIGPSNFQIAHTFYGPSYISFESALSYHQWIPESVYVTTCATSKRATEFETPLGTFQYIHVPKRLCLLGVQRVDNKDGAFFIAEPWKAIADHYYAYHRKWKGIQDLYLDMRIEMEDMLQSDLSSLQILSENYQSPRVRKFLGLILKDLKDGNKNH